jgi:iron complex outermembrane receptor protein
MFCPHGTMVPRRYFLERIKPNSTSLIPSGKVKSMKATLQGRKWIAVLLGLSFVGGAIAEEPNFRLLELAEQAEVQDAIRLVQLQLEEITESQAESISGRALQPTDIGASSPLDPFVSTELSLSSLVGDWANVSTPGFSTAEASSIDTVGVKEAIEGVQGTKAIALSEAPAVDLVSASTFNLTSTPDAAETIINAPTTQTVKARQRSQLGFDPRIRGFYTGQIYATHDGAYQFPVRSDLDGVFSKIDQALIGNVQVISGPYTVRYGSGFSFLNVDTIPAPRYEDGWENHLRLGTNVRTNGGQTYNTATLFGGGEHLGYFANIGYRKGSDYQSGDGLLVPSSYDTFNLFSGIGFDIDDETRSELRYTHINQDNTEYAGQFFDVDSLESHGLTHSLIHRNDHTGFAYRVDAWVNHTEFNGDTANASKRRLDFPVLQRVDLALARASDTQIPDPPDFETLPQFFGAVDGELLSSGVRAGVTQDIDRDTSIGFGTDFRYMQQEIDEDFDLSAFNTPNFNTGLPSAEVFEPGIYAEYSFALRDYVQTAVGARVGFASTQADPEDIEQRSNFRDLNNVIDEDLDVSDVLTSFFITNDVELSPAWKARVGMGYAERLPNLEQRYSDGLFLAIIQNGFSRLIGNPTLNKERNWQVDARLDADYDYVRMRLSGFHSWVLDYVTYEANEIASPDGSRLLRAINTEYATLTGFEYYCEADLATGWQAFGSLNYLDGRDREIDQPLAGINPLEGRLGIRLVDPTPANRSGVEWGWRIVDNQDRLGTLRAVAPSNEVVRLESATPGFATSYLRAYYRPSNNVSIIAGAENLFDNTYFEHLNLRLPSEGPFGQSVVLSPGLTPYFGVEVDY